VPVRSLHAEDLLVILSVQAVKDLWQGRPRLSELADIAELVRSHEGMNWASVRAYAKAMGSQRMLFLAFLMVEDLLGPVLPEGVLQEARSSPVVRAHAAKAREHFWGSPEPAHAFATFRFHLDMCGSSWFKCRFVLRHTCRVVSAAFREARGLATPTELDRAFLPLPKSLAFLHYLSRPIRLLATHRLGLVRHSRRLVRDMVGKMHGPFL
jgi:hypothetical protein